MEFNLKLFHIMKRDLVCVYASVCVSFDILKSDFRFLIALAINRINHNSSNNKNNSNIRFLSFRCWLQITSSSIQCQNISSSKCCRYWTLPPTISSSLRYSCSSCLKKCQSIFSVFNFKFRLYLYAVFLQIALNTPSHPESRQQTHQTASQPASGVFEPASRPVGLPACLPTSLPTIVADICRFCRCSSIGMISAFGALVFRFLICRDWVVQLSSADDYHQIKFTVHFTSSNNNNNCSGNNNNNIIS